MSPFDFVRELIVLGLDSVILSLCVREYLGHKRSISALKVKLSIYCAYITQGGSRTMILSLHIFSTFSRRMSTKSTVTWSSMSLGSPTIKSAMPWYGALWSPSVRPSRV